MRHAADPAAAGAENIFGPEQIGGRRIRAVRVAHRFSVGQITLRGTLGFNPAVLVRGHGLTGQLPSDPAGLLTEIDVQSVRAGGTRRLNPAKTAADDGNIKTTCHHVLLPPLLIMMYKKMVFIFSLRPPCPSG